MSRRETEIVEVDFDDFLDNACDMSQPRQGRILKIVYEDRPFTAVCYIVHPDDVAELNGLVNPT